MIYYMPTFDRPVWAGAGAVSIRPRLTVARIQDVVADFYEVPRKEMTSARRSREVARPRQVAMYLAKTLTGRSLPHLGRLFNRDHTTIIHGARTIAAMIEADKDFAVDVQLLKERLGR